MSNARDKANIPALNFSSTGIDDNATSTAITIDSNNNVAFLDGTGSLPSITNSGDKNTGIYFPLADTLGFSTGGLERMRLNYNSGIRLSVGTTSDVSHGVAENNRLIVSGFSGNGAGMIGFQDTSGNTDGTITVGDGSMTITADTENTTASSSLRFRVDNNEKMRIDSSGNVGIGTSSPSGSLEVFSAENTATFLAQGEVNNPGYPAYGFAGQNLGNGSRGAGMYLPGDGILAFSTAALERMRIDSSGRLLVGTTSADGQMTVNYESPNNGAKFTLTNSSSASNVLVFNNTNGTVGYIQTSGTSTSYNTSSDYRLKENVNYDFDATSRLKQLKPARFNFIADANTTVDGFLAHEVSSIVPEAITGTKDEVDADGNPKYQGIDQSKLVPLLVKTIQELEARITALETQP